MNGGQDLGGMMGFGPVAPEKDEPVFHADWEKRALAVTIATGALGGWTIDESRHARETLAPQDYLTSSYYEIWLKGLTKLLLRKGLVSEEELSRGQALGPAPVTPRPVPDAETMRAALARGGSTERSASAEPRYRPGDIVRTIVIHPAGHTRLPRYARGKTGRIESVNGIHVFPDTNAHGGGELPQALYTVAFEGPELWGRDGDPGLVVNVDCWESYLEPAP